MYTMNQKGLHVALINMHKPHTNHERTLDLKLFQGGYMVAATCSQPYDLCAIL